MDRSNGYEGVVGDFAAGRGGKRSSHIGVASVRRWAKALPRGSVVLDAGCGTGMPLTETLLAEGLGVFAIDAAPSMVEAFRSNLPGTPVACEAVQDSRFFDRMFDAVLAWGLVFLLAPDEQSQILLRLGKAIAPGGSLLFTAPAVTATWSDAMTGMPSYSLGAEGYGRLLASAGLAVVREFEDEGKNHYYEAVKG